jgi:hypothetical protein
MMQLKNIRKKDAHNAIQDRLDFGIRASAWARENLDVVHSLRGYAPLPNLGYHNPEKPDPREMPRKAFNQMCDQMERLHVAYIIESYETVIAWVDGSDRVHIPPFRYSLTTTQHQHTAAYALTGQSFYRAAPETERAGVSLTGTIGRRGW